MTYNIKSTILSTILILVTPILLARFFFLPSSSHHDPDSFQLAQIPISAVLTRALATANTTRSHGLLTHALLEFQNPELTTFAGPGYGVHLRNPNRGALLEAFPNGQLPKCGARGRYDEWGRVRALRYAYQRIVTIGNDGLMGNKSEMVDSLLMGWPAMLLEAAGVSDPLNPMPPGSMRNAYNEAVNRVAEGLMNQGVLRGGKLRRELYEAISPDLTKEREENDVQEAVSVPSATEFGDSPANSKSVFAVAQFLSIYSVARANERWLMEAVKHLQEYYHEFHANSDPREPLSDEEAVNDSSQSSTGAANRYFQNTYADSKVWVLAGAVRVLSVIDSLEKWESGRTKRTQELWYERWQYLHEVTHEALMQMVNEILLYETESKGIERGAMQITFQEVESGTCRFRADELFGSTMVASSVFRLAQLALLDNHNLLEWADRMYDAVAQCVQKNGTVSAFAFEQGSGEQAHDKDSKDEGELQSAVIMMWAARRDCEKVGTCRKSEIPGWWSRLS